MSEPISHDNFLNLGISEALLATLAKLKYTIPTPIQVRGIPIAMEGKDMVGIAQTGTGKTLAFGLPMIQRLYEMKGRGLVVLPTRELAIQVEESLRKIGAALGIRTAVIIGGASMSMQIRDIRRDPHIIIATPGRLNDHLDQRTLKLDRVRIVVLDEADRMLDMGFAPQIKQIFAFLPPERQTMLFSATMPPEIMRMATAQMKMPINVEVAPAGTTVEKVTQELFLIDRASKISLVKKLLEQYSGTTLIFTRTKHGAKKLAALLRDFGESAAEIHSNRSLGQRKEALAGFKSGKYRILVATDIASRGIDVTGIELVINFDLPENSEDYVHRIGRTARAGAGGHAISLVMPDQRRDVADIERLVKKVLPISSHPDLPKAQFSDHSGSRPPRRQQFHGHRSGGPSSGGSRFGGPRQGGSRGGHRPGGGGHRSGGGGFRQNRSRGSR